MSKRLQINIDLDNDAFSDHPETEVGRILGKYLMNIAQNGEVLEANFKDYNGNTVGSAKLIEN